MADTETPETVTEEIPSTETPPAETEENTDPPAEAQAEATAEPEPATEAAKAKEWDKDRQKRAEERAAKEKARDEEIAEEIASLKQTVEELKKAKPPAPATPAAPTASELQAMADEVETLTDPANDKFDLYAARKVEVKLRKATLERQQALDERLRIQEAKDAETAAESRWWSKWKEDHPDCDQSKAKAIVDAGFSKFSKSYTGPALGVRVAEELENRLAETKTKSPPPRVAPKKPPTAPASAASPPGGTQVVPAASGARPKPVQIREAESILGNAIKTIMGRK